MSCSSSIVRISYTITTEPCFGQYTVKCGILYKKLHKLVPQPIAGAYVNVYDQVSGQFYMLCDGQLEKLCVPCSTCVLDTIHMQLYQYDPCHERWDPVNSVPQLYVKQLPSDVIGLSWQMPCEYIIMPDSNVKYTVDSNNMAVFGNDVAGGVFSYLGIYCSTDSIVPESVILNPSSGFCQKCVLVNVRLLFCCSTANVQSNRYLDALIDASGTVSPDLNNGYDIGAGFSIMMTNISQPITVQSDGIYFIGLNLDYLGPPANSCGSPAQPLVNLLINGVPQIKTMPNAYEFGNVSVCVAGNNTDGVSCNSFILNLTTADVITVDLTALIEQGYSAIKLRIVSFSLALS